MSRICQVTNKRLIIGNNRSHALNATKRSFLPNVHFHRFWSLKKKCFIKLQISSKGIRIIDKYGIDFVLNNFVQNIRKKLWLKIYVKK